MSQMCPNPECSADNREGARFCSACRHPLANLLGQGVIVNGRYRTMKVLGCGGMGAVYLAEDVQQGSTRYVLKELMDVTFVKQFDREAAILKGLSHPQLPKVYDSFSEGSRHFLLMEYIDGHTLEDVRKENEAKGAYQAESVVFGWAVQLVDALEYLHGQPQPVIHRDIKPANLIHSPNGQIRLVDFGIAKLLKPGDKTATDIRGMGSRGYAPIEQYTSGNQGTDVRSDVYALGATLYALLTNVVPPEPTDRIANPTTLIAPKTLNASLSDQMSQVILRTMAIRPDQRYQTATEMKQALMGRATPTAPCPHCAAAVPQGTQVCHVCGHVLVISGPFVFRSGESAYQPGQLSALCDKHSTEAMGYLYDGSLERWLALQNRHDLAANAEAIRKQGGDRSAGLEAFLHIVDPQLPMPKLKVSTNQLLFGVVRSKQKAQQVFSVSNVGRGYLVGALTSSVPWLTLTPSAIQCPPSCSVSVVAEVEVKALVLRQIPQVTILVSTADGQNERIDATVRIAVGAELAQLALRLLPLLAAIVLAIGVVAGVVMGVRHFQATSYTRAAERRDRHDAFVSDIAGEVVFGSRSESDIGLSLFDVKQGKLASIVKHHRNARAPHWLSDGSMLVFVSDREGNPELFTIDIASGVERRLTTNRVVDDHPKWSPDGRHILFESNAAGFFQLYVLNLEDGSTTEVTSGNANNWLGDWSPDGEHIVFASDRGGDYELYAAEADGSGSVQLTDNKARDVYPAWSPDGGKIVFVSDRDGNEEIYIMAASGGRQTNLTRNKASDSYPAWTPEGDTGFVSDRPGSYQIFVMNDKGDLLVQLIDFTVMAGPITWKR